MKKFLLISAAVLGVFSAHSCIKESVDTAPEAVRTVISVSLPSSKTALGDKDGEYWANYWKEGDKISVNGVKSDALGAEADGLATANFSFEDAIETPYCAVYPAAAASGYSEGSATVTLPSSQVYVAGSYNPAAFIMGGKSNDASLALSPFVSIVHISLSGSASISSVRLTGAAGTALSGDFTTDFSSYAPKDVSNVVEMVAETPVALPADFFICVPAGLSGSLKVEAFGTDGGTMTKTATIKKALAAGEMYSPATLAYSASYDIAIRAEGITSSTAVICWDNSPAAAYTVGVYSDPGCTSVVNSYSIPEGSSCWSDALPRFCISGLSPGTTYYVKVANNSHSVESNILLVKTEEFEIVEVSASPAAKGDVILAEDFGELRWDSELISGGVGYFPTSQDSFANSEVDQFLPIDTNSEKQLSSQTNALMGSRLANWAQGENRNIYIHPGYLKLVGSSKVTHLVTPALLNIPDGMVATLEVEVTACPYFSESSGSFCTDKAVVAVQPAGDYDELLTNGVNTLDLSSNIKSITLTKETAWKTYKVTISGVGHGDRLAFGADKKVTKNDARMNISAMKVTIKELYSNDSLTASVKGVSSSTAAFTWTHIGSASGDIKKPYTISLYKDAACSNLFVSFDIEAESSCWGDKIPCFVFGGLRSSTTYWFVAEDTADGIVSEPVSATTNAFEIVEPADVFEAGPGDVLLAEDFREIGAGPDELAAAAGFVPSSKVLPVIPSGVNPEGIYVIYKSGNDPFGDRIFGAGWDLGSSRLSFNWGFFGNSSTYYGAGYLRLSSSTGRTHVVTPALSGIPAGKLATIEVAVTAAKYIGSGSDVAVYAEKGLIMNSITSLSDAKYRKYTGASLSDGHPLGLTAVQEWETKSVIISNVDSDCQLLIGSFSADKDTRFYISDVVVTLVSVKEPGTIDAVMEISDFDSFKAFLAACQPGKSIQGDLTADIALTSAQAEEIDALYPVAEFDGIINGNNHSISGLVKPLFAEFSGTVSDLTLNSNLSLTAAMNNIGILAGRSKGATISGCVTNGSVALNCASEIDGDLSMAGMVGLNDGGTMTGCVNNASVTNNSSSKGEIRIGGIAGVSHAAMDSCSNTGDITNNGSTYDDEINVAGVVAFCIGDMTSCSNEGSISNTATSGTNSIQDLQIGGIAANVKSGGYTLTSCFNTGSVSNSGAGSTNSVGGIAAWSNSGTFVTCHNSGAVSNSGLGSSTEAACGVRIGGIVGSASDANTLSGDADNYNYNEGTILENSESARITIGGICGWTNNAGTTLDYAQNKASGDITISGGTRYYTYVGGILGCNTKTPSFSYTRNAGDINFDGLTVSYAVYAGGIHGGFLENGNQTITGCENTGDINCPNSGGNGGNMKSTSEAKVVTYIGGISGVSGDGAAKTGKTFTNCINRGAITVYNQLWTRLGGCFGYGNINPSGCENHGKIVYYRYKGGNESGNGAVGGVIGYINIASVSNLTNTGGVQSTGSSPNCYTGGIVGQEGGNMNTMTNCYIGNSGGSAINIVGAGSGTFGNTGAGLFVASGSKKAWTFTGCEIISGTKCQSKVIDEGNLADAVVGRNHATSITDPPTFVESF